MRALTILIVLACGSFRSEEPLRADAPCVRPTISIAPAPRPVINAGGGMAFYVCGKTCVRCAWLTGANVPALDVESFVVCGRVLDDGPDTGTLWCWTRDGEVTKAAVAKRVP